MTNFPPLSGPGSPAPKELPKIGQDTTKEQNSKEHDAISSSAAEILGQQAQPKGKIEKEVKQIADTEPKVKESVGKFTDLLQDFKSDLETLAPKKPELASLVNAVNGLLEGLRKDSMGPPELITRRLLTTRDEFIDLVKTHLSGDAPLIEAFVDKSLNGGFPSIALKLIDLLPSEKRQPNFFKVMDYYMRDGGSRSDFQKAIVAMHEFPEYGPNLVLKVKDRAEERGFDGDIFSDTLSLLPPHLKKIAELPSKLIDLEEEGKTQEVQELLLEYIKNANDLHPNARDFTLTRIAKEGLLPHGMIKQAVEIANALQPHQDLDSVIRGYKTLYSSIANYYVKTGELPLMYEWLDKLPNDIVTENLPRMLPTLGKRNDTAGMKELLNYTVNRGIPIDDITKALLPKLNTKEHFELINLLAFYGADPQKTPPTAKDNVKNLIEQAAKVRLGTYQLMATAVIDGSVLELTKRDVGGIVASYLAPENLTPEQIIDLANKSVIRQAYLEERAEKYKVIEGDVDDEPD